MNPPRLAVPLLAALSLLVVRVEDARAGCGCAKPPPARAAVRPFVGHTGQAVTLFDERFQAGRRYRVEFASAETGISDWSIGFGRRGRDLADGVRRMQLTVEVGDVPLGPASIRVWAGDELLSMLGDEQFTVVGAPIPLHDFAETITRPGYRAAVGRDGSIYLPVDVSGVTDSTTFTGVGHGLPFDFGAEHVAMYNDQGYLMQLLDPADDGLFEIRGGDGTTSDSLTYWRHEFRTYKGQHRHSADLARGSERDWHADGTPHVDHDHLVVAIRGRLGDGSAPSAGATPPFTLVVESTPDDR